MQAQLRQLQQINIERFNKESNLVKNKQIMADKAGEAALPASGLKFGADIPIPGHVGRAK